MVWFKAFVAGFLATLIFHQGLFAVFYFAGVVPKAPFNLAPVPPFGVPSVISLAFFGGLWGLALWALIGRLASAAFWCGIILLGAIGPTTVAMLLVFPAKGLAVSAQTWIGGLILNGFWGFGVAIFMVIMGARRKMKK